MAQSNNNIRGVVAKMKAQKKKYMRLIDALEKSFPDIMRLNPKNYEEAARIGEILEDEADKLEDNPLLLRLEENILKNFKYVMMFRPRKEPSPVIAPMELRDEIRCELTAIITYLTLVQKKEDAERFSEKLSRVRLAYKQRQNGWGWVDFANKEAFASFVALKAYMITNVPRLIKEYDKRISSKGEKKEIGSEVY